MVAYLPSLRTILLRLRASSATPSSLTALTSSSLTQTTSYCPQSSRILPLLQHTTPQPPISGQILASSSRPSGWGWRERYCMPLTTPRRPGAPLFPLLPWPGYETMRSFMFSWGGWCNRYNPFLLSLKGPCE